MEAPEPQDLAEDEILCRIAAVFSLKFVNVLRQDLDTLRKETRKQGGNRGQAIYAGKPSGRVPVT